MVTRPVPSLASPSTPWDAGGPSKMHISSSFPCPMGHVSLWRKPQFPDVAPNTSQTRVVSPHSSSSHLPAPPLGLNPLAPTVAGQVPLGPPGSRDEGPASGLDPHALPTPITLACPSQSRRVMPSTPLNCSLWEHIFHRQLTHFPELRPNAAFSRQPWQSPQRETFNLKVMSSSST